MNPSRVRLGTVECLEDRSLLSAFGVAWPDAGHLTLSFAPDGTHSPVGASSLGRVMASAGPPAAWQREMLRAFQTWAVNANINIGLVADGGQAFGTPGAVQGDTRFGDIRIGAAGTGSPELAGAAPFSWVGTTLAGDVLFNTAAFSIGGAGGSYDIFSVALHEAGHVFGLDHPEHDGHDEHDSVMGEGYAYRTGLSAQDIAALQALYGVRSDDAFDAFRNNGTRDRASVLAPQLTGAGTRFVADGDLTTLNDVDFYKVAVLPGQTSVTVRLQAQGLSLVLPRVTVYDSAGRVVASGLTRDPLNNDLALRFNAPVLGGSYFLRVEGATEDVFGIGGYRLTVDTTLLGLPLPPLDSLLSPVVDGLTNDTLALATNLVGVSVAQPDERFDAVYRGVIESRQDTDYYRLRAPLTSPGGPTNLNVVVWGMDADPLDPRVRVYDALGNPVAFQVLANDAGLMSLQIPNITPGRFYHIQVSARTPGAANGTGSYLLGADFNQTTPLTPNWVAGNTLAPGQVGTGTITVTESGLYQLFLAASQSADGGVVMTVTDGRGNVVATVDAAAGQPLTTAVHYLAVGKYKVTYRSRSAVPVRHDLLMLQLSENVGPYATTTTKPTSDSSSNSPQQSSGYTYEGSSSQRPSNSTYYYF